MLTKFPKKYIFAGLAVLILLAVAAIVVYYGVMQPLEGSAEDNASSTGQALGNAVGNCVGSFNGLTEGQIEGYADGKAEALEANDIEMKVKKVKEIGRLEVLNVTIKRTNNVQMNNGKSSYLYMQKCSASYSVDLSKAAYKNNGSTLTVTIPLPECESVYDDEPEQLAEYHEHSYTGSTKDAITALGNSEEKIREEIDKELGNDSDLYEKAKASALNQVKILFESISVEGKEVDVVFAEDTENE